MYKMQTQFHPEQRDPRVQDTQGTCWDHARAGLGCGGGFTQVQYLEQELFLPFPG